MLPDYLKPGYFEKMKKLSSSVESQLPLTERVRIEEYRKEKELENERMRQHRVHFEKRAEEVGFFNALAESAEKVDFAVNQAESALKI